MEFIPSIDIKNKKCIRLTEGKIGTEVIYSDSPLKIAKQFEDLGAKRLHIVDIDGAFNGEMINFDTIKEIRKNTNFFIDVGGGIRDFERIKMLLDIGINRIVLGTIAIKDPSFVEKSIENFSDVFTIGIDVKYDYVLVKGWTEKSNILAKDFIKEMSSFGINEFIWTDITRDGTMKGINTLGLKKITSFTDKDIIVSGGVSNIKDLEILINLNIKNIKGVISGKAIYTGKLDIKEALALLKKSKKLSKN